MLEKKQSGLNYDGSVTPLQANHNLLQLCDPKVGAAYIFRSAELQNGIGRGNENRSLFRKNNARALQKIEVTW